MFTDGRFLKILIVSILSGLVLALSPAHAESRSQKSNIPALKETPKRIVALNWSATEALLLLGVTPAGVADRDGYPVWVKQPALPEGIANVGRRSAPSMSAIAELKPDLIVVSSQLAPAREQLERIAPTYVASMYTGEAAPFQQAKEMLLTLGRLLDREDRARDVIDDVNRTLAENRERLEQAGLTDKPVALVGFMDARHLRINAPNGLFQAAIEGLGLTNTWQQPGSNWGFATIGLDKLAERDNARLVAVAPISDEVKQSLDKSPFWNHLPAVQHSAIYQIEPVWAFGGVYAVKRMGQLLTQALMTQGRKHVR